MKTYLALVAGFVLAFVSLSLTAFQAPGTAPSWPPAPRAIVNWLALQELGAGTSLGPGEELSILAVPSDRWLVLTEWAGADGHLELIERKGGVDVVKRPGNVFFAGFRARDAVGLTFQPGSELILRNIGPDTVELQNQSFVGYYSR